MMIGERQRRNICLMKLHGRIGRTSLIEHLVRSVDPDNVKSPSREIA